MGFMSLCASSITAFASAISAVGFYWYLYRFFRQPRKEDTLGFLAVCYCLQASLLVIIGILVAIFVIWFCLGHSGFLGGLLLLASKPACHYRDSGCDFCGRRKRTAHERRMPAAGSSKLRRSLEPPVLDEHARSFINVLIDGDDNLALSLLADGRVTVPSPWNGGPGSQCSRLGSYLLSSALNTEREQVAIDLIRRGADIDALHPSTIEGTTISAAGYAIAADKVSVLSLCHSLGARLTCVCMMTDPSLDALEPAPVSAVEQAIRLVGARSLKYLLDNVYPARPVVLSVRARHDLCMVARMGLPAMRLFEVLRARGYDFDILKADTAELDEDRAGAGSCRVTLADFLVTSVRESGDAAFMRFIVKKLGFSSTPESMAAVTGSAFVMWCYTSMMESARADGRGDLLRHLGSAEEGRDEAMIKFECAACKAVCATEWCTGCRKARYCSALCQKRHWGAGGHKRECRKLQRRAKKALSAAAGPS